MNEAVRAIDGGLVLGQLWLGSQAR